MDESRLPLLLITCVFLTLKPIIRGNRNRPTPSPLESNNLENPLLTANESRGQGQNERKSSSSKKMTQEEKEAMRKLQVKQHLPLSDLSKICFFLSLKADAAIARSKNFQQGGGGENLKAKAQRLEEYEKKNKELGEGPGLKWTV